MHVTILLVLTAMPLVVQALNMHSVHVMKCPESKLEHCHRKVYFCFIQGVPNIVQLFEKAVDVGRLIFPLPFSFSL